MKFCNTNPPPDYPRPPASRLMVSFHGAPACAPGSVGITNHPRGPIRDDSSGSGVLRADNGMPVGHINYQEGIVTVLPEPVLDAIEKWHMPNSAHKLNADQTVPYYGTYNGDPFWVGWCPLPKRRGK